MLKFTFELSSNNRWTLSLTLMINDTFSLSSSKQICRRHDEGYILDRQIDNGILLIFRFLLFSLVLLHTKIGSLRGSSATNTAVTSPDVTAHLELATV